MQSFQILLAGGIVIPITIPQQEPVTASDIKQLIKDRAVDGWSTPVDEVTFDLRALIGVQKL